MSMLLRRYHVEETSKDQPVAEEVTKAKAEEETEQAAVKETKRKTTKRKE